ncbi:hypothetical protein J6590_023989 [Homalodisca vitripennis]|nr:hypothetical protein J6590_023989 [Homalodisca vitripennis]
MLRNTTERHAPSPNSMSPIWELSSKQNLKSMGQFALEELCGQTNRNELYPAPRVIGFANAQPIINNDCEEHP